jgi:hypothetical protein
MSAKGIAAAKGRVRPRHARAVPSHADFPACLASTDQPALRAERRIWGAGGGAHLSARQHALEDATGKGGGGMPAFEGTLSEEEIGNVAAYVVETIVGK